MDTRPSPGTVGVGRNCKKHSHRREVREELTTVQNAFTQKRSERRTDNCAESIHTEEK